VKISPRNVDQFLGKIPVDIRAVLLHGPDKGLVRERSDTIVKNTLGNPPDPFQISEIPANDLRKDPERLAAESATLPLAGDNKVIRITDVAEKDQKIFNMFLGENSPNALVLVEAGELRGNSALKRLFDNTSELASIGCYPDEARDIRRLVRDFCEQNKLRVTPDALEYLALYLGSDRMVTRQELEKLLVYLGPTDEITEGDAMAVVGDSAAHSLNVFAILVADGNKSHSMRTWASLRLEGINPVQALRTTLRHFQRLHQVAANVAQGGSSSVCINTLRPPVHFSVKEAFERQVHTWSLDKLSRAMMILAEAEEDCKKGGGVGGVVSSMAFLRIVNAAQRLRRP
tara:strand:+ start:251 stop:1282 length:1032 start_codon:yes stop_codon:yes gene_type:complete